MNRPETVSALSIRLPQANRSVETYKLSAPKSFPDKVSGLMNRIAFYVPYASNPERWRAVMEEVKAL